MRTSAVSRLKMPNATGRTWLAVATLALLSSIAGAYPITLKDSRGKSITIKTRPARIVSIAPSNTEILYALGLADRIAGVTTYCYYPTDAKKKPKVGDMTTSPEAVLALKPDLVVAHANVNRTIIPTLEKLGLRVFAIDPRTIAQVMADITTLGKITSRPASAARIVSEMSRSMNRVRKARSRSKSQTVLVSVQANPLWAAGPKTFVDEMLRIANARNAAFDARPGFVTFSKELAVSRNPDLIIVGTQAEVGYLLKDKAWRTTKAVKQGQVYAVSGDYLVRPGPRLAVGLEKLASLLEK